MPPGLQLPSVGIKGLLACILLVESGSAIPCVGADCRCGGAMEEAITNRVWAEMRRWTGSRINTAHLFWTFSSTVQAMADSG